jgi:two-component system nitrogen regulation response regulator GlnG
MEPALSILVVDDHPAMGSTLYDILDDLGYQVTIARTGQAEIEQCLAREFDVVLMDVRMPDLNGVETYKRIKTIAAETQVIMMSADVEDVVKQNAYSILKKPLDIDNLLSILERIQRQHPSSFMGKPGANNE